MEVEQPEEDFDEMDPYEISDPIDIFKKFKRLLN